MKNQKGMIIISLLTLVIVLSIIWCRDKGAGMSLFTPRTPIADRRGGRRSSPGGRRSTPRGSPGGRRSTPRGSPGGRRSTPRGSPGGRRHPHRRHPHRRHPYNRYGYGYGNYWPYGLYNRYPWYNWTVYTEPEYGYYEPEPQYIYQDAPVYGRYKVTVFSDTGFEGDKFVAQGEIRDANMTVFVNADEIGFEIESAHVEGPVSVGFSDATTASMGIGQVITRNNPDLNNNYASFRIDFPRLV